MMRHKLVHPIKYGDARIEELSFRRPTFADLRAVDAARGQLAQLGVLLTKVSTVVGDESLPITEKMIDMLDVEDVTAIGEKLATFFPKGQATGASD